jgi:hypothetical protein
MPGEPEAVPADYQRQLTERAHVRERVCLQREWSDVHDQVDPALGRFADRAPGGPKLSADLRFVRHAINRIDRRLAL